MGSTEGKISDECARGLGTPKVEGTCAITRILVSILQQMIPPVLLTSGGSLLRSRYPYFLLGNIRLQMKSTSPESCR